ncbi:MAG: glycosyltransferase family 4 protein [Dongiaceae bacterium]
MTAIYLGLLLALFISMLLTPQLVRYAHRLRLMDAPDPRKSHATLIPRVGGIAVAIGAALPCLVWLRVYDGIGIYLAGAAVIVIFGIWDDRVQLDYRMKLLGQLGAVLLVVAGGVRIAHLPLAGLDPIPIWASLPITVVFLVAVTNAFNLLDGLDGLAAGCAILSVGTIGLLAFLGGSNPAILVIAAATIGGVLGFLRYNTHPATVFMGDSGSQLLGFTIGVLTIMLMEQPPNAMSAAVPLLLLGLPVLDTAMVMLLRLRDGRSPFSPDRNHIHHKLLSLGFRHHEAVAIIYAVQALIVFSAFLFRYQRDWIVLAWYVGICALAVATYLLVRRSGFRPHETNGTTRVRRAVDPALRWPWLGRAALAFVEAGVAVYLMAGAIAVGRLSADLAAVSLLMALIMLAALLLHQPWFIYLARAAAYLAVLIVTYYSIFEMSSDWFAGGWVNGLVAFIAIGIGIAVYFRGEGEFQVTTLDLLMALVAIAVLTAPMDRVFQLNLAEMLVRCFVIFYAIELLLGRRPPRFRVLATATVATLALVSLALIGV